MEFKSGAVIYSIKTSVWNKPVQNVDDLDGRIRVACEEINENIPLNACQKEMLIPYDKWFDMDEEHFKHITASFFLISNLLILFLIS